MSNPLNIKTLDQQPIPNSPMQSGLAVRVDRDKRVSNSCQTILQSTLKILAEKLSIQEAELKNVENYLSRNYSFESLAYCQRLRQICLLSRQYEVMKLLVRSEPQLLTLVPCPVFTAFITGDRTGAIEMVKQGAILNKLTHGRSLLHYSIRRIDFDFFKILIEHGAPINIKDFPTGNTSLQEFMLLSEESTLYYESGEKSFYTYLVLNGADLNTVNTDGESPIMFAAKSGNTELYRLFLELGADPIKS